jgi:hypothetical protein
MLELHVPFFVGAKFWSWTCPKEMHIAQTYVGTENCIRLFPLYWDLALARFYLCRSWVEFSLVRLCVDLYWSVHVICRALVRSILQCCGSDPG